MMQGALQTTVLIVEDDKEIRRFVQTALSQGGHRVIEASTMRDGLMEAGTRKPDLIILDLGLPDGDGQDFIRDLRAWSRIPIIVLSARIDEADKVTALDSGADDYLTKPFSIEEMLARVRAALRRVAREGAERGPVVHIGDVALDLNNRRVTRAGEVIHLTPIEYRLLARLVADEGKVLTHRQLLRDVWGPNLVEHNHYLRIYMGHLRHKIESDPAQPKHLLTETGVGYRLVL